MNVFRCLLAPLYTAILGGKYSDCAGPHRSRTCLDIYPEKPNLGNPVGVTFFNIEKHPT